MMHKFGYEFLMLFALNSPFGAEYRTVQQFTSEGQIMVESARPRPGYFAELEELEAARKAGTTAAYDLFIERHPESRYADIARSERKKLNEKE